MDITFRSSAGKFKFRVAGVILHEQQILLTRDNDGPYYYLPGGKLRFSESSEETIVREMREELHEEVAVERLLWVVENFFREERIKLRYHEFSLYYLLKLPENSPLYDQPVMIFNENNEVKLEMKWVPFAELSRMRVYPRFLKERVYDLPLTPEHIVIHE